MIVVIMITTIAKSYLVNFYFLLLHSILIFVLTVKKPLCRSTCCFILYQPVFWKVALPFPLFKTVQMALLKIKQPLLRYKLYASTFSFWLDGTISRAVVSIDICLCAYLYYLLHILQPWYYFCFLSSEIKIFK